MGIDLFQGTEFVLRRGPADALLQVGPVWTRLASAVAALRRARVWELQLGLDPQRNWEALRLLLDG